MKETGMLLTASLAFSVIKNINRDEFFATLLTGRCIGRSRATREIKWTDPAA